MDNDTKQYLADWDSLDVPIDRELMEPMDAYGAFCQYAWLQHADRTLEKVQELTGFTLAKITAWSKKWQWEDRAIIVDGVRWAYEFRQQEKMRREEANAVAVRNRRIKERGLSIVDKMMNTAERMLASAEVMDEIIETDLVETKDGRQVPTFTQINMKHKVSDIPRMVEVAVRVNQAIQALPTEIVEEIIPKAVNLESMTTEELKAALEKNKQEIRNLGHTTEISPLEQ